MWAKHPLHKVCFAGVVTNLDFAEFFLEAGACPNAQDPLGITPLMFTMKCAPGATNFLLNWPTTNVNLTNRAGESFLSRLSQVLEHVSYKIALPYNLKGSNTNSCSSGGVTSKRNWYKGAAFLEDTPIRHPFSALAR
jgi:ankyrin repeat protein